MNEPRHALVLDDNLMSSVRLRAQLEQAGYTVEVRRALPAATAAAAPDCIIINLGSRPLRGVDLIAPGRERFPASHVIGFCGHLEVEIRQAAKAAGIDRLLTNEQAFSALAEQLHTIWD